MLKKISIPIAIIVTIVVIVFVVIAAKRDPLYQTHNEKKAATPAAQNVKGRGIAAIENAAKKEKYLFVFFYKNSDEQTKKMRETFNAAMKEHADKAQSIIIEVADPAEKEIVDKFKISRAPMPLVLAIAPNGAVTGGFPQKVTKEQLKTCFVSELIMKILKPMQKGKVVLVLLQNSKTKFNSESAKAAFDFAGDKKLNGFVEIIEQDPRDTKAKDFLKQCKLDKNISQSTIVFLVPPGRIAGVFPGKTTKETLLAALASCSGGSCAPGACSPIK